jgi:AraC-like DNA-binding protein
MRTPVMRGLPHLASPALEILARAASPPPGPVRCGMRDKTECGRLSDRTALRNDFARIGLRCEVDPTHDAPFDVDLSLSRLPGLQMATGRLSGARSRRTRALLDTVADDAALIVNLRGRHLIAQRGTEIELSDGEAVLVSWTEPCRLMHQPPGEALALRFPKTGLAQLICGPDDRYMQVIPGGTEALGLLTRYVALAWDDRMTANPELQRLMASHIYELMAVLVGATADAAEMARAGGTRAARLNAIKQDIEKHLDQPGLSVVAIAGRNGCTPRLLQRLFETEGTTFTDYVLSRRIAWAHRLLRGPRLAGEKVCTIAYMCGFGDVSYFNRVFRRHCGLAPSEMRAESHLGGFGPETAAVANDKAAGQWRIQADVEVKHAVHGEFPGAARGEQRRRQGDTEQPSTPNREM